jgi:hypothetical protein
MFVDLWKGIHVLAFTMLKWNFFETNLIIYKIEPMGWMESIVVALLTFVLGPSQVNAWLGVVFFKG